MSRTRPSKARNPQSPPRQTNKDRPRPYRLSPTGLKCLRAVALRNKPWLLSSGPKTAAGKARSKLNATKHGERSAKSRAAWRELNAALRSLDRLDRDAGERLEGVLQTGPDSLAETWAQRIADDLRLADFFQSKNTCTA